MPVNGFGMEGENFIVRFPDGFEKSLELSQLEVLKRFKGRLGEPHVGITMPIEKHRQTDLFAGLGASVGHRINRTDSCTPFGP